MVCAESVSRELLGALEVAARVGQEIQRCLGAAGVDQRAQLEVAAERCRLGELLCVRLSRGLPLAGALRDVTGLARDRDLLLPPRPEVRERAARELDPARTERELGGQARLEFRELGVRLDERVGIAGRRRLRRGGEQRTARVLAVAELDVELCDIAARACAQRRPAEL